VDEWGCMFDNVAKGIIGVVKQPLVTQEDWSDAGRVHIPEELLTFDVNEVNAFCRGTDRFVLAGCCPRPFEQLQFIRTTEELYKDLMDPPPKLLEFLARMHDFLLPPCGKMGADGCGRHPVHRRLGLAEEPADQSAPLG
ncbi:MAG: hypothetical protein ACLSB9_33355, partial [Hydrogeniiclostridium mannosilyticum]